MSGFLKHLWVTLFHLGYFGPLLMGVLDSSFLFLPFGNDFLLVGLIASHHEHGLIFYVLAAATGSLGGVVLLDMVSRKAGEEGIVKLAGERRFNQLKKRTEKRGGIALFVGCIAPPPFPFTIVVATMSALGYPRRHLLWIVWVGRLLRFLIVGLLALAFGRLVLWVAMSPVFRWSMGVFIAICVVGSGISIAQWVRHSRPAARARA